MKRHEFRFASLAITTLSLSTICNVAAQEKYSLKPTPKRGAWAYDDARAGPFWRGKWGDKGEIQTPVASTAAQDEKQRFVYVKHLEPPLHYPPLARQVQFQGTVVIKLTIGADGNVLAAKSLPRDEDPQASAHPLLTGETEKLLKKWTFGCTICSPGAPYEKKIKFIYRLEGEPNFYDDTRVSMDLPDEVIVTVSPIQCDHCPTKKKGNN